jgi:hypothetical protein
MFGGGVFEKKDADGNVTKDDNGNVITETRNFNPSTYEFNIDDFTPQSGNVLDIIIDKKVFIVLGIPMNAKVASIEEKTLGD